MRIGDPVDVCIVGCGPGGAVLGAALVRGGVRVLVLESGPRFPFAERPKNQRNFLRGLDPWQALPDGFDVSSSRGPIYYRVQGRQVRGVGGTSLHWGGDTPRFQANDFRMRSLYGVGDDWPISYAELEPYYVQAEAQLGVSGGEDPFASPRSAPYPMAPQPFNYLDQTIINSAAKLGLRFSPVPQARNSRPYQGRNQCQGCGTCNVCPIGAKASVDLTHVPVIDQSEHGRVVENVTVLRLETDGDRVRRAVYAGLDRVEHAVEADIFVIGAGAIETPRLLLLSTSRDFPDGLANRSSLVGKRFMEHLVCGLEGTVAERAYVERISFNTTACNQFWDTPARAERSGFSIQIPTGTGQTPVWMAERSGLWGDELSHSIQRDFGHTIRIESPIEILPNERNQVDLDPDLRDYFGNPAPRIYVSSSRYEDEGIKAAWEVQRKILEAHGASEVNPGERGADPGFWSHQSGTCRMGSDPKTSVVDQNLRAHDISNLYLIGSSVFVTVGMANPTLTITALALRLADHLLANRSGGTP
jgi:choline dehydrogenase-like flavoprotein